LNENVINIDYNNDLDKIQSSIQMITGLLNELKTIEDSLLQQSTQSLAETCEYTAIESPILLWIPKGIQCENYVAFNIQLIRTRSILQERKVNLEEKETKLWNEIFTLHEQQDKQGNRFHQYLNPHDEEQTFERKRNSNQSDSWILPLMDMEGSSSEDEQPTKSEDVPSIELNIKLVPCTSSVLIQQIQKYREEPPIESTPTNKAQKFTIIHPDGKTVSYLCKIEKLLEQLKKLCDGDVLAVVDKNEIFFDLINYRPSYPLLLEYHIIEKQWLIQVQFRFRTQVFEYSATSKCNISTIIHRFIDDNHLKSLSADLVLGFFDESSKCIDDGIIADLCKTNSKIVVIFVTEETANTNTLCEITLRYNQGN
jgi:hypothetical protein